MCILYTLQNVIPQNPRGYQRLRYFWDKALISLQGVNEYV